MNVLEAASVFKLEALPSDWVEELWGSDFNEDRDLPAGFDLELEEDDIFHYLSAFIDSIKNFRATQDADKSSSISWQVLVDLQFDHKSFTCLISTFIKSNYTSQRSRILGLLAARLYINLLSIPGAIVLNVFNPFLYRKVLSTLKLTKLCSYHQEPKKLVKKKSTNVSAENTSQDNVQEKLSESEKERILFEAGLILNDMVACFSSLHLADEYDSQVETIKILVELSRLEKYVNVYSVNYLQKNSTAYITKKAYDALECFCVEEQGYLRSLVMYISSCILPSLTLNEEDYRMQILEKNEIHKNTLSFIKKLHNKKNKDIDDGVMALFQQLCMRIPDKEDIKAKLIPNIIAFLMIFNQKMFHKAVLWVISLMHNKTLRHRLIGADIVAGLMNVADIPNDEDESFRPLAHNPMMSSSSHHIQASDKKLLYKTLFAALLSGICDSASSMRSKCLSIFSRVLLSSHLEIKQIVNEIFSPDLIVNEQINIDKPESGIFDFYSFFDTNPTAFPSNPLPDGNNLVYLVSLLTTDEKVFVRKNACQALARICLVNENFLTNRILKIFILCCKDFYVSVRKSVANCLTDLILKYPYNNGVISAWVDGVVQLVVDNETKSSEKIIDFFKAVVIDNITKCDNSQQNINILPWKVIKLISKKEKTNLLGIACLHWNQQGHLRAPLFRSLQTHIGTDYNDEVWYFISCLSNFTTIPNSDFIYHYYVKNIFSSSKVAEYLTLHVLESLYLNWRNLKSEYKEDLYLKFKSSIEDFDVPFPMISRSMDYIYFYKTDEMKAWCGVLVEKCERHLKNCISPGSPIHYNENLICQYIVTLGEAALFHPGVHSEIRQYISNIIDHTFLTSKEQKHKGRWKGTYSVRLRGVAIVTLGKICLQDQLIAKSYASLFAGILNNSSSPTTLKINSMIALSDLCRRFTSVVEDYLGNMCISLRDDDINVRKNTLKLLMALIQEDFLRVKTPIFYYLLIMILDTSQEIRDLTESFIINSLKSKHSKILSQYFISTILFFNNYEDHPSYSMDSISHTEKIVFSLSGVNYFKDRRKIYKFMLTHMVDIERFSVSNRLCTDIMAYINEDKITLDVRGTAVLKDALSCLSCKEIKMENLRKTSTTEETDDGHTELAKRLFLSTIIKKNYMDHIIPVITTLKKKLMDLKSPLVKDLMLCLRELMRDFKGEVNNMLDDPLLATEIEHDLRNADNADAEEALEEPTPLNLQGVSLKDLKIVVERLSEDALMRDYNVPLFSTQASGGSAAPALASPPATPGPSEPPQSTPSRRTGRVHSAFSPPLSPVTSREPHTPQKRLRRSQSTIVKSSPVVGEPTPKRKGKKKGVITTPSPVSSPSYDRAEARPGCSWMPDKSPSSDSAAPSPLPGMLKEKKCSKSPEISSPAKLSQTENAFKKKQC